MALPVVGLMAVIENLADFEKGADAITQSYDEITEQTQDVAQASAGASKALDVVGGVASAVATGGLTLLVTAVAAVATAFVTLTTTGLKWASEFDDSMRKVGAQTGATGEELEALETTAQDIFQLGLGENFEEVAQAMATVGQVTGATDEELQELTTDALTLSEVFDKDIGESVRAVDQAMIAFGADGEQVFDLVTASIQATGDPADDLLDTVSEYSQNFAEAGFTAEEMFGVLNAGLEAGAFNFDKVGDVVREFFIRMKDGSDTTAQALDELFDPGPEAQELMLGLEELNRIIEGQEQSLIDTKEALELAKGAWGATKQVVSDLRSALSEATAQLNEMARPKLEGMEQFDDRIFGLTQQIKQARLAMLDMDEDTPAFEAAREELDGLNKELEKTRLAKEIQFEPVFRALEESARAGTEEVLSADEAFARIAAKKTEVEGLTVALSEAEAAAAADAAEVQRLETTLINNENALKFNRNQVELLTQMLEEIDTPAKQFLDDLAQGAITGPEAMSEIISALKGVEDPLRRNQIGAALFGSMWEDLGESVILAMDPAELALANVEGATDKARETISTGLGPAFEQLKRTLMVSVAEGFEPVLASIVESLIPAFESFAEWLQGPGQGALTAFGELLSTNLANVLQNIGPWLEETALPALTNFAAWFQNEGLPAIQTFINWVVSEGWPKFQEVAAWFKTDGKAAFEDFKSAIDFLIQTWQTIGPIISVVVDLAVAQFTILTTVVGGLLQALSQIIHLDFIGALTTMQETANTVTDIILGLFGTSMEELGAIIGTKMMETRTIFEERLQEIQDFLSGLPSKMFQLGSDLIAGLIDGIKDKAKELKGTLTNAVDEAVGGVKDLIGWKSPAQLFIKMGTAMVGGLIKSLSALRSVEKAFKKWVESMMELLKMLVKAFDKGVDAILMTLKAWVRGQEAASREVRKSLELVERAARDAAQSIRESLSDIASAFTSFSSMSGQAMVALAQVTASSASSIISSVNAMASAWVSFYNAARPVTLVVNTQGITTGLVNLINQIHSAWVTLLRTGGTKTLAVVMSGITTSTVNLINSVTTAWDSLQSGTKTLRADFSISFADLITMGGVAMMWSALSGTHTISLSFSMSLLALLKLTAVYEMWKYLIEHSSLTLQLGVSGVLPFGSDVRAPSTVQAPSLIGASTSTTTNVFQLGGNTFMTQTDEAVFEARVMKAIRRNLP